MRRSRTLIDFQKRGESSVFDCVYFLFICEHSFVFHEFCVCSFCVFFIVYCKWQTKMKYTMGDKRNQNDVLYVPKFISIFTATLKRSLRGRPDIISRHFFNT